MLSAIGIDLGGTNTKIALVSENGKIIKKDVLPTLNPFDKKEWVLQTDEVINDLKNSQRECNIAGIGIGIAGLVDPFKKVILQAPNIVGIDNWNIGEDLISKFKISVEIDNDVNVMALGEFLFGEAKKTKNAICLTLGTGVGGGLILNGDLFRGSNFMAGELGHITINENGPQCNCGNFGCAETYLGNGKIIKKFKQMMEADNSSILNGVKDIDPSKIFEAAKKGDYLSLRMWSEFAAHLATLLSGLVNLLNPDKIILGGGVSNAIDVFKGPLIEHMKKRTLKASMEKLIIIRSKLSQEAGVIGAASLVFNKKES